MGFNLKDKATSLKGIGPSSEEKLAKLDIQTIGDLLSHYPTRYLDFSKQITIRQLRNKEMASFTAKINDIKSFYTNSGKQITQATATDNTGRISLSWFNNFYIKKMIRDGEEYTVAGKPSFFAGKLTIIAPILERGNSFSINTKGLVPVYPQTEGITSKWLRSKIFALLNQTTFSDPIPTSLIDETDLISREKSYRFIHFPPSMSDRWQADKRLAYDEHLKICLNNLLELQKLGPSISVKIDKKTHTKTNQALPFKLTEDQETTIDEIYHDLSENTFTHRLIQGDTGSGKTATLLFAAHQCLKNNLSSIIMAPTEILAEQHFSTFKKYSQKDDSIQLITGSANTAPTTNKPMIYIGTHALITNIPTTLKYPVAFIAIDEQHKFGVAQREELLKRSPLPHLFNLSATPIPRTVALGLLGDIEISNISHKPLNRLETKTHVVSPERYKKSTTWLTSELKKGNKIFVVCPNISDKSQETASVEKFTKIYREKFPNFPIWEIHGKIKAQDQRDIIESFKKSPSGILISTSLIEVGIDIPSANIMVIHSAERFGLAQLHQLRGRVGRGEEQGFCFLVPTKDDEIEIERLQLLQKYDSGLILAQKDLRLRGSGEVFGIRQHGALPTRLKYFWSKKLFLTAKKQAKNLIKQDIPTATNLLLNLSD